MKNGLVKNLGETRVNMFLCFFFIFDQGRFLTTGSNFHACCDIGCPFGLFFVESGFGPYGGLFSRRRAASAFWDQKQLLLL